MGKPGRTIVWGRALIDAWTHVIWAGTMATSSRTEAGKLKFRAI